MDLEDIYLETLTHTPQQSDLKDAIQRTYGNFQALILTLENLLQNGEIKEAPSITEQIDDMSEKVEEMKNRFQSLTKYYFPNQNPRLDRAVQRLMER